LEAVAPGFTPEEIKAFGEIDFVVAEHLKVMQ
jgi:acyl CoA:acetate/3-ketoacid CoA transferase beta subunit